ncbi:MAG: formylglycine-generating enzyme family protein [Cyanobacteria bacterium CRU_2_1]|nr:formylglycine-generating enzyme family protein [Leptolyngbyaceae cyanobacterium RU_5_1]NJR63347.1 formylglycine-generating enzyme family protein [Cyanobacteria bacterium CRU_2_1]
MPTFTIQRQRRQAQYFTEDLGSDIGLDMILVPAGSFLMGSPATEPERLDRESPQHPVTVPFFFMGRYPVTQQQWNAVEKLQSQQKLTSNPSHFKGDDRPVESVSWHDAIRFCERLSAHSGREYRLPTEAEWEYACRAGTTTPFHVGETITTDLANYNGTDPNYGAYGRGSKGIYRSETTDVGSFPPNAFGFSDMHGNVWEWCLDHWHENYKNAPTDGSAWLTDNNNAGRVIRGGSWNYDPRYCRSAYRLRSNPDDRYDILGFRVVCVLPRTP